MRLAVALPAAAAWSVTARGSKDHDARNTDRSPPAFTAKAAGVRCETAERIKDRALVAVVRSDCYWFAGSIGRRYSYTACGSV